MLISISDVRDCLFRNGVSFIPPLSDDDCQDVVEAVEYLAESKYRNNKGGFFASDEDILSQVEHIFGDRLNTEGML